MRSCCGIGSDKNRSLTFAPPARCSPSASSAAWRSGRSCSRKIENWSLTSRQQRSVKTGGRLVKHARYYGLMLAERSLTKRLIGSMTRRIGALAVATGAK